MLSNSDRDSLASNSKAQSDADEKIDMQTQTAELVSNEELQPQKDLQDQDGMYGRLVASQHSRYASSILRFVPKHNKPFDKSREKRCFCLPVKRENRFQFEITFGQMNAHERRERLHYLRFRFRVIVNAALFVFLVRKHLVDVEKQKMARQHTRVYFFDDSATVEERKGIAEKIKTIWHINMSFWLWFNLLSSPLIILWPEISENKRVWYMLWMNELCWLLDIIRKFFDKPKRSRAQDFYEIAV